MSSVDRKVARIKQKQAGQIFKRAMEDGIRQQALFYQCLNLMPLWKRIRMAFQLIAGKVKLNEDARPESV